VPDFFQALDSALESVDPIQALDALTCELRAAGRYDLWFDIRGMRKRLELGLPPIWTGSPSAFPPDLRPAYDDAIFAAAREAGELYLAAGNIPAGYRYLRAVGDTAPVAAALEKTRAEDLGDSLEDVISIALQHGLYPLKGIELILRHHGMCRAITAFGTYPVEKDRQDCIALLVRELHAEVVERMARTIEQQEGVAPSVRSLPELMTGRDWMFGEYDYYVDTSHLVSLIPYCLEPVDVQTLQLLDELCAYGRRLAPNFAFKGQPPFEDGYVDYGHYIQALMGRDTESQINYFRARITNAAADGSAADHAQLLVVLLARLERYQEALAIFLEYLTNQDPAFLRCPSAIELAYEAKDYVRMRELSRARQDVVSYAAAQIMTARAPGQAAP